MITPIKFKQLWTDDGDELVTFDKYEVEGLPISNDQKRYLYESGLPMDAAPFLTFGQEYIGLLKNVSDVWKLPPEYSKYRIIGSTGSGDPICIDESNNGCIVYLDHDNNFKCIFINSSLMQLVESLLAYRNLVNETIRINGEDAYLDGMIPETVRQETFSKLKEIDNTSMASKSFWKSMLK